MGQARSVVSAVILALAVSSGASGQERSPKPVPVLVGGEADYDACGAVGAVQGLNPDGDGFLAVRSGPGTAYAQRHLLYENDQVILCDHRGEWIAVVFAQPDAPEVECGLSSPIAERRAYAGPCRWGWAHENWITLIAG